MATMQSHTTDTDALPRRCRTWLPLTGLTDHQFHRVLAAIEPTVRPASGRPWALPLPDRVLLILIHLRTKLTTRALAALFGTSQSTVDGVIHHLVPPLADGLLLRRRAAISLLRTTLAVCGIV